MTIELNKIEDDEFKKDDELKKAKDNIFIYANDIHKCLFEIHYLKNILISHQKKEKILD